MERVETDNIIIAYISRFGLSGIFLFKSLRKIFSWPFPYRASIKQIAFVGARSMLVITVSGLFVGMVLSLQFYDTLVRFGSVGLLGSAVGLSLIRELGPVLTALMVIGRAGSAMCAEIGIMRTDNQIDALDCMAIDSYRYLFAPRMLAGIISMPLLTAIFIIVGIFGGYIIGVWIFGVSAGAYFQSMADTANLRDVFMGISKSFVFGLIIVWVACDKGYYLHLDKRGIFGSEGVSKITTEAVVISAMAVLFSDYLLSAFIL